MPLMVYSKTNRFILFCRQLYEIIHLQILQFQAQISLILSRELDCVYAAVSLLRMEGSNDFWLYFLKKGSSRKVFWSSLENQLFTSYLLLRNCEFSFSTGAYSFGRVRGWHSAFFSSTIRCRFLMPDHQKAGFLFCRRTFWTMPMDLKTLMMSQSRRILVLMRAESSVKMSSLAACSSETGPVAKMKTLRKRAARFSSDFSFLEEKSTKSEPFLTMRFMVSTASFSPRQTQLFFDAFLTTRRLQKIFTISYILLLSTWSWTVTRSSSRTMPSLPQKRSMNFLLSSSRLFSLRLQLSIFCLSISCREKSSSLGRWVARVNVKMGNLSAKSWVMMWVWVCSAAESEQAEGASELQMDSLLASSWQGVGSSIQILNLLCASPL